MFPHSIFSTMWNIPPAINCHFLWMDYGWFMDGLWMVLYHHVQPCSPMFPEKSSQQAQPKGQLFHLSGGSGDQRAARVHHRRADAVRPVVADLGGVNQRQFIETPYISDIETWETYILYIYSQLIYQLINIPTYVHIYIYTHTYIHTITLHYIT